MKFKRLIKAAAVFMCAVCLCALFTSCGEKLTLKNGKFTNSKTGVTYSPVRGVYLPKSVSSDPYIAFKTDSVEINYYSIEGLSPEEWLVSETDDLIYSGNSKELPTLAEFGCEKMIICRNTEVLFSIIVEDSSAVIDKVIDRVVDSNATQQSFYCEPDSYKVLFDSEKYEYFYYQLKLYVTDEGMYLLDMSSGAYYEATDIFGGYSDLEYAGE